MSAPQPPIREISGVASALGAAVGQLANLAPIAIAGANVAAGAIAGGAAAIPALLSLLFPKDPASIFRIESTLPVGSDPRVFGLKSDAQFTPETVLGRGNLGILAQSLGPQRGLQFAHEAKRLGFAARQTFSFSPLVAAQGEAELQRQLTRAPTSLERFVGRVPGEFGAFGLPGFPEAPSVIENRERFEARRVTNVAGARVAAAEFVQADPVFQVVEEAFNLGLLPGGEVSPALAAARGQPVRTRFPVPLHHDRADQPFQQPFSSPRTPPGPLSNIPTPMPAAQQTLTGEGFLTRRSELLREAQPMPDISTNHAGTGFLGGALSGFANLISAATPLAAAILPSVLNRPQGGQAFFPTAMPGGQQIFQPTQAGFGLPGFPQAQPAAFQIPPGLVPDFLGAIPTTGGACISPVTTQVTRLPSRVDVPTIDAGGNMRFTTFKNMGKPILWSGDLAACKRVRKAGAKARRFSGG